MSMRADSEGKAYDDINVTPMVDLYLVLLLIFIIMTTVGVQGLKVHLPKSSDAPSIADKKHKPQAITVTHDGQILLSTVPVTMAELQSKLEAAHNADPEVPVIIRGDSAAQYQGIIDVINLCSKLGITQVGLATKANDKH